MYRVSVYPNINTKYYLLNNDVVHLSMSTMVQVKDKYILALVTATIPEVCDVGREFKYFVGMCEEIREKYVLSDNKYETDAFGQVIRQNWYEEHEVNK